MHLSNFMNEKLLTEKILLILSNLIKFKTMHGQIAFRFLKFLLKIFFFNFTILILLLLQCDEMYIVTNLLIIEFFFLNLLRLVWFYWRAIQFLFECTNDFNDFTCIRHRNNLDIAMIIVRLEIWICHVAVEIKGNRSLSVDEERWAVLECLAFVRHRNPAIFSI